MLIRLLLVMSLLFNGWPMAMPAADASLESGMVSMPTADTSPCHGMVDAGDAGVDPATGSAAAGQATDCCAGPGCDCACLHASAFLAPAWFAFASMKPAMGVYMGGYATADRFDPPENRPPIA